MVDDFPQNRIVPSWTVVKIGAHWAESIITKPNPKRTKITLKVYIAQVTCFWSKAVLLEVVSDLTTEDIWVCLKTYVVRR